MKCANFVRTPFLREPLRWLFVSPLQSIYKMFRNSAIDKYVWIVMRNCEVLFVYDCRWKKEVIAWEVDLAPGGSRFSYPFPKKPEYCRERSRTYVYEDFRTFIMIV